MGMKKKLLIINMFFNSFYLYDMEQKKCFQPGWVEGVDLRRFFFYEYEWGIKVIEINHGIGQFCVLDLWCFSPIY